MLMAVCDVTVGTTSNIISSKMIAVMSPMIIVVVELVFQLKYDYIYFIAKVTLCGYAILKNDYI